MSIVKDLYDIFDKEQSKFKKTNSLKSRVIFEIKSNFDFLREAIRQKVASSQIISKLDETVFEEAVKNGFDFNKIRREKLHKTTSGGIKEFDIYLGKDTKELIENAYRRIRTLKKIASKENDPKLELKIKYLFKFHALLVAHIEGKRLKIPASKR